MNSRGGFNSGDVCWWCLVVWLVLVAALAVVA
jgi:uncharacterized membrane protein